MPDAIGSSMSFHFGDIRLRKSCDLPAAGVPQDESKSVTQVSNERGKSKSNQQPAECSLQTGQRGERRAGNHCDEVISPVLSTGFSLFSREAFPPFLFSFLILHCMADFEIAVVGAGVVGLAIAARLSERHKRLVVLEKNEKYGMETSSRNSEVIHAGIYYTPGSLKARLCVEGRDELYRICRAHNVGYRQTGKIITATSDREMEVLEEAFSYGTANGVPLELLNKEQTLRLEPHIRTVGSILSPMTGIVSAHELMDHYHHAATNRGATVQLRCEVVGIEKRGSEYSIGLLEGGGRSSVTCERVINSAGLYSDRIAQMAGIDIDDAGYRMVFAKGSYFSVPSSKARLVSRLIYPVPNKETLGVHVVLDLVGRVRFGPDTEYLDELKTDYSVAESKRAVFAESVRHILPAIADEDLTPDISGIRPKLQRKGEPEKDWIIVHEKERGLEGFYNLIGMESPALTASAAIARYVDHLLK
jgi:L-2-hydroxyglutarate oxidase LhgO